MSHKKSTANPNRTRTRFTPTTSNATGRHFTGNVLSWYPVAKESTDAKLAVAFAYRTEDFRWSETTDIHLAPGNSWFPWSRRSRAVTLGRRRRPRPNNVKHQLGGFFGRLLSASGKTVVDLDCCPPGATRRRQPSDDGPWLSRKFPRWRRPEMPETATRTKRPNRSCVASEIRGRLPRDAVGSGDSPDSLSL